MYRMSQHCASAKIQKAFVKNKGFYLFFSSDEKYLLQLILGFALKITCIVTFM